jgi:hypothetical protein
MMNRQIVYLVFGACLLFLAGSVSADLVGHWPLDGNAEDVSGNGLNGTIVLADPNGQPNFIEGAVGLALDFSGGNDYVNIDGYKGICIDPNDPDRVQPAFSVMNWFTVTAASGDHEMVTWGTSAGRQRLTWRVHEGRLRTEHASGNLRGNTYVNDGEWHHGALTVAEGANLRPEVTKLYVDGALDTTFSGSDNPYELTAGSDVRFGMSGPQNSRYWPGALDDVWIYDHVLSQADIRLQIGLLASYAPTPTNGAIVEDTSATLSWTAGPLATEHDVYFGTNPTPGPGELLGRQAETTVLVDLDQEQTYYWRVDDVEAAPEPNDPNAVIVHTGEVWSFTVPVMGAYDPMPADGQAIRDLERTLSWTPGWSPLMHAVYVSTDQAAVTSGAVAPTILIRDAALDIGPLEPDTTYYWAVDEFYGDHWSVGPVWSLTTAPAIAIDPNADPNLVVWLTMDEAPGDLVVDMSGNGNHAEVMGGAQVVEGMDGMAMEFDGVDDYLDLGDNSINGIFDFGGTAFTISAWINPSQLLPKVSNHFVGNILFSRGSDAYNDNFELGIVDANLVLYTDTEDGLDETTTLGSGDITVGEWHEIAVVFDAGEVTAIVDAATYTATLAGTSFDQADGSPFTIGDTLHDESPYSGLIDDVRIYNRALTAAELGFVNLKQASEPIPADGEVVLPGIVGLIWTPGEGAVSHDVYMAMGDAAAVEAGGDTFVGNQEQASMVLGVGIPPDPFVGGLTPGATYYWRIDEVDADGTTTVGKVWSFTLSE